MNDRWSLPKRDLLTYWYVIRHWELGWKKTQCQPNRTGVFTRFFGGVNFERRRNGMQSVPILPESNSPEVRTLCRWGISVGQRLNDAIKHMKDERRRLGSPGLKRLESWWLSSWSQPNEFACMLHGGIFFNWNSCCECSIFFSIATLAAVFFFLCMFISIYLGKIPMFNHYSSDWFNWVNIFHDMNLFVKA